MRVPLGGAGALFYVLIYSAFPFCALLVNFFLKFLFGLGTLVFYYYCFTYAVFAVFSVFIYTAFPFFLSFVVFTFLYNVVLQPPLFSLASLHPSQIVSTAFQNYSLA